MGYVVLHLDKSPDNEVPMTAHIARTKMPPNAIPELTYLNEELVEYPKGVADRTEAINHRLNHAGLTRKIGTNQVRVIRVMLTGSQEDMKRLAQEGRLKAWCADNLTWLRKTFGTENVVSAVLHMDEATPHIHAAVVPIVTGERRKVRERKSTESGKRKYHTKSNTRPRLCADDVMSRVKLKEYQDTYAAAMAKYGLQRGIDGSKARHVTTQEFYRNAIAQQQNLQDNIGELLRIAPRAFVSFPNFAHWRVRLSLLWTGRMPVTRLLPVAWYETPNIHHVTVRDFRELLREKGIRVEGAWYLSGDKPTSDAAASWRAEHAIFLIARG